VPRGLGRRQPKRLTSPLVKAALSLALSRSRFPESVCPVPRAQIRPGEVIRSTRTSRLENDWNRLYWDQHLFLDLQRVSRSVILDLEFQKSVNGPDSVGIVSGDTNFRTSGAVSNHVGDSFVEPLHCLYPGRCRCVDKHRNGKITL
jgi:hypothetical protein